jgi:Phospholipid N-methyltransferase
MSMITLTVQEGDAAMEWEIFEMFWNGYLTDPLTVASVAPDSKWCIEALLRHAHISTADFILEYGPASGTVTREIIRRKNPSAILVCVEKNKLFVEWLMRTIKEDNCHIEFQNIFDSESTLRQRGVGEKNVDCIISTLPCTNIPFDRLLEERVLPYLNPEGIFVQYMHVLSFLRGMFPRTFLESRFESVTSEVVWLNIPPAIVYTCTKPKHSQSNP